MRNEVIRAERIDQSLKGLPVLNGMTCNVYAGEILGILSTSQEEMQMIGGILSGLRRPERGQISLFGRFLTERSEITDLRSNAAYIGSAKRIADNMTIAENIYLATSHKKLIFSRRDALAMAEACLYTLGLSFDPSAKMNTLSQAEQRQVELAIAWKMGKKLIILDDLLDEPLTSPNYRETFLAIFDRLRERGIALVLMTSSVPDAMCFCDRITIMRNGKDIRTVSRDQYDLQQINTIFLGTYYYTDTPTRHKADTTQNCFAELSFQVPACDTLDLSLIKSEVTGIIDYGNVYVRELLKFASRDSFPASIFGCIDGKPFSFNRLDRALSLGIGFLYGGMQPDQFYPKMDARFNLDITLLQKTEGPFISGRKRTDVLLHDFRLTELCDEYASPESFNEITAVDRQRFLLGRWLITRPRILILVNPYAHFQPELIYLTNKWIDHIAELGTSVIIFHNYLPVITPLYDRLIFMDRGVMRGQIAGQELAEPYLFLKELT